MLVFCYTVILMGNLKLYTLIINSYHSMRTTYKTAALILGMFFILPGVTLAEETGAAGSASVDMTVMTDNSGSTPPPPPEGGNPVPPLYRMNGKMEVHASSTTGVKGPGNLPSGAMMKGGLMASGTKPLPKGIDMRNKMTASGTKPIPPGMEDRMEGRDNARMRMMGSGTPEKFGRGDCGPKASSSDCGDKREKGERLGEMLKRAAEVMFHRINAAIERFTKLADRIDSRVAKLKAGGTDTSIAEGEVAAARVKLKEAQDALDAAKVIVVNASVSADASSTMTTDSGKPVREQLEKAKKALIEAAKDLQGAVAALRGLGKGGEGMNGTSSQKMPGMMRVRDNMSTGTPDGSL